MKWHSQDGEKARSSISRILDLKGDPDDSMPAFISDSDFEGLDVHRFIFTVLSSGAESSSAARNVLSISSQTEERM
jgi:hypothetical protein